MADSRALTIQGGVVQQIANADALIVGDGVITPSGSGNNLTLTPDGSEVIIDLSKTLTVADIDNAGATLSLGATAGAVDISSGGVTTTVNGPLTVADIDNAGAALTLGSSATSVGIGSAGATTTVNGPLTVVGVLTAQSTSQFEQDATFNGNVQFGDGTGTDLVEFHTATRVGSVSYPDITLSNDANHSLFASQSASEAVGRNVSVVGGQGGDTATVAAGGEGGTAYLTGGAGGAGDGANLAGGGGEVRVRGGAGGTNGGAGGAVGGLVWLAGGAATGDANGGTVQVDGGSAAAGSNGQGGLTTINGGQGEGTGRGGWVTIFGGYGNGTGDGGDVRIEGGSADSTGSGANVRVRAGAGTVNGNVVIGDAQTVQVSLGAAAIPTVVGGVLRGPDDGTGVVLGHAGTAANTGSAPQMVNVSTTERGYLDVSAGGGMMVWNVTDTALQYYDGSGWQSVASGDTPWTEVSGVVYPDNASDDVVVGGSTMLGTEKFRVIGQSDMQGDLEFETGADRYIKMPQMAAGTLFGNSLYVQPAQGGDESGGSNTYPGNLYLTGGDGGAFTTLEPYASGSVEISGGEGASTSSSGDPGGTGGSVGIAGGRGGDQSSDANGGAGGDVLITGGQGRSPSGTGSAGPGGDVIISGGSSTGGVDGIVVLGSGQTRYIEVPKALQGVNANGSVVIGHASSTLGEGSALQLAGFTTSEKGNILSGSPNAGSLVWDTDLTALQWYDGSSWNTVGTAGSAGGWTDDGTIVRLTTSSDSVAIGTASLAGTEKLRVVGNTSLQGNIDFEHQIGDNLIRKGQAPDDDPGRGLSMYAGTGGNASSTGGGQGGYLTLLGGAGGDGAGALAAGAGYFVRVQGGGGGTPGTGDGGAGGDVFVEGGDGSGNEDGGSVSVLGGVHAGTGTDGPVNVGTSQTSAVNIASAGITTTINDDVLIGNNGKLNWSYVAGEKQVSPLQAPADTTGAPLALTGGPGGDASTVAGAGGYATLYGGYGGAGTGALTAGAGAFARVKGGGGGTDNGGGGGGGGNAFLEGGNASGNEDGGDAALRGGTGAGTGADGSAVIGDSNTSSILVGNVTDNPETAFRGTGDVTFTPPVKLEEQAADPSTAAAEGALYTKEDSGATHLFFRSESDGTVYQLTPIGGSTATQITIPATASENIAAGAPVNFHDSAGNARIQESDANGTGTRPNCVGLASAAISTGVTGDVVQSGEADVPDAQWDSVPGTADVGEPVYVSSTIGNLTLTAPGGGATVVRVGYVTQGGTGTVKVAVNVGEPVKTQ